MQYEQSPEKVTILGDHYTPVVQPLRMTNDLQLKRTRKTLLILISIFLVLSVLGTIGAIIGLGVERHLIQQKTDAQVCYSLVSDLFYGFGLLVTYKYYKTGLCVFACLTMISLVLSGIWIVVLFILWIRMLVAVDNTPESIGLAVGLSVCVVIFTVISIAVIIVTVIMIKLTFKLARLIDTNDHLTTQPI